MTSLRSPSPLVLLLALAGACVAPLDPSMADTGSETTEPAEPSTGAGGSASATSTTGEPPATAGTTFEITATAGEGTTEDTGMVYLSIPDGGACNQTGDGQFQARCSWCTPGLQDCPEGEKCVPWANDGGDEWNATRCSPVPDDPAGLGEPCVAEDSPVSGFDDCALGLMCFGVDPRTLQGTCAALCDPYYEPAGCAEDEVCVTYDDFAPHVCMSRCDPTAPACAAGESCRPIGGDALCVLDVVLPQGLDCAVAGQHCAVEEACLPADELASCGRSECCTPWCDLSAADPDVPCSAVPGEVCRPFFDAPPAGYEHVGVCGLPL